ncbi:MAG: phosphoribosylamine--glycine ligase [Actinomycetota bacterium]
MRVLVVGGGGREHALAWRLAQSPLVEELLAAPGNAGIASVARCVAVPADDIPGITALVERERIDLTVVGPEGPLVAGLADELVARGRAVFGPSAASARIEGSKAWAKELMLRHGIPTAHAGVFTTLEPAIAFVDELGGRAVVKADGLAAGKGVTVAADRSQAVVALEDALVRGAFGDAGTTVLVEEVMEGPEVSAFALCDADTVLPFELSQDFKRIGDGDLGPNTGGMGAYSPVPSVSADVESRIWSEVVSPTFEALRAEGSGFRGLLYAGLMLTEDGPKVVEFNCRFGDPETEVVVPRLRTDLAELLLACATDRLADAKVDWLDDAAVTVVLASEGYPGAYTTGAEIVGLPEAAALESVSVFHAGTTERDGRVVTAGGRVLAVSALGRTLDDARARAYEACGRLSFDGMQYRRDIAETAAGRESR